MVNLDYLDELEAEAIHILREVAGQFEKPALLFSGGKDSITLVRLAEKAFRPGKFPFPLVHIDTGHNFQETIDYRDKMIDRIGEKLIVGYVQESIDAGKVVEQTGKNASRNSFLFIRSQKSPWKGCICCIPLSIAGAGRKRSNWARLPWPFPPRSSDRSGFPGGCSWDTGKRRRHRESDLQRQKER